jgi:basic amino acid/polyamine antiporter, APA family
MKEVLNMEVKKEIRVLGGISILAGIMIGSGIFFLGGQILFRIGNSLPLSLLAWLIGGLITLFSGLTYAELGTLFPENGGYYIYLKKGYGKKMAFLAGLMNLVLSSSGSIALLAILFGQVLSNIFPATAGMIPLIAIGAIVLLSVINYFGVKAGTITQIVFMVAKLIPIVAIIILGLFLGEQTLDLTSNTLADRSFFEILIAFSFAVVGTLWAYEGWTNLNTVAGEMKNPDKDLPKSLVLAILGVTLIYVLFIFALYRLVAYGDLLTAGNGWFIFNAAYALFGEVGALIIMVSVAISVFGALNGCVLVFPRVYQKMAVDGLFFKPFERSHEKYKTPVLALIISGVMSILLIVLGFDINALLTFIVFAGLIFNTLIFISVFLFRKRMPKETHPRGYEVWGYPVVPIIAIIGMVMLLIATLFESLVPSLIGVGVLVVGYFVYPFIFKENTK